MSFTRLTILVASLATAIPANASAGDRLTVSGFVGGWFGPGWWSLEIDSAGRMEVLADVRVVRRLTPAERATLARLVSALPVARPKYDFGLRGPVDATAIFALTIHRGSVTHEYYFGDHSPRDHIGPDLTALERLWHFLRGLFESDEAAGPGPVHEPKAP
jgi:hypothetical protein